MAKAVVKPEVQDRTVRVRRGYFESRYGQLHVHNAIPPGGGFDEGTSLLCLHATPRSGASILPLLTLLGADRSVYAPDLPGYGHSDAPPAPPTIADYAAAVADFCTTMRFRQIDVAGCEAGALVAAELALQQPTLVRRVALACVPLPTEAEREAFRRAPWPLPPAPDGGHLLVEWRRVQSQWAADALAQVARSFADRLLSGPTGWWGLAAALQYPAGERLRLLTQPCLLLRPRDDRRGEVTHLRDFVPRARSLELPEGLGGELFEAGAEPVARALREFLRG